MKTALSKRPSAYLQKMFLENAWTRYVDKMEKKAVVNLWLNNQNNLYNQNILDLGMGPGRWSKMFIEMGFRQVTGLDIEPKMVASAKKNIRNSNFNSVVTDMQKLPFKNNSFNKIFSFRSFKYVKSPNTSLSEIRRVIAPDGSTFIEFPNNSLPIKLVSWLTFKLMNHLPRYTKNIRWYLENSRFYQKDEITKLTQASKLTLLSLTPLFILPARPLPTLGGRITWFWICLDKLLSRLLPPEFFARSWVLIAEKPENK